jgi:hypothetical protein
MSKPQRRLLASLISSAALLLGSIALLPPSAGAQAIYAANGPGSYASLGGTVSMYASDYGQRRLGGATVYVDANVYRRIGVEAEFRTLRLHTDSSMRETTWLVGPKISMRGRSLRTYAQLLVGRGQFNFPFSYAKGSYFVVAPGVGVDWSVPQSRLMVRLIDFEYQDWPQFTFGAMHPYGISAGVSIRLFQASARER